jgi:hypothetical protein
VPDGGGALAAAEGFALAPGAGALDDALHPSIGAKSVAAIATSTAVVAAEFVCVIRRVF